MMLFLLFLGVLLWSLVHLFPSLLPAKRASLKQSMGSKYDGIFALAIVFSIVLMVIGWKGSIPEPVFNPPVWGRHLTMLLVLVAIILFGAANAPTRIRRYIRHPMLTGVIVWGVAHLLANGDIRSLVLFGGMTLWAGLSIYFINRRDGEWAKPMFQPALKSEVILVAVSIVLYLVLVVAHPYFAGMALMPG